MEQLLSYVDELEKTLRFYVQGYMNLSEELANAQGLILNQQNTIFGRSSQRSSVLFGKEENGGKAGEQEEGQENGGKVNGDNTPGNWEQNKQKRHLHEMICSDVFSCVITFYFLPLLFTFFEGLQCHIHQIRQVPVSPHLVITQKI